MRKHNVTFQRRWSRERGDRSNFPQQMAHFFVNSKESQIMFNALLCTLMLRAGIEIRPN